MEPKARHVQGSISEEEETFPLRGCQAPPDEQGAWGSTGAHLLLPPCCPLLSRSDEPKQLPGTLLLPGAGEPSWDHLPLVRRVTVSLWAGLDLMVDELPHRQVL